MRHIVTDGVAWSVCLVCHSCEPCKNGWTDQGAIWVWTWVGPRNHVLDGVKIPDGKGQFCRGRRPIVKFRECCLFSSYAAFCQIALTTCWNLNYHTAEIAYRVTINLNVTSVKQELSSCWDGRPFGHNRQRPKVGRGCCGRLGPHLTQYGLGLGLPLYQVASWSIQPFGHNCRNATLLCVGICLRTIFIPSLVFKMDACTELLLSTN